MNRFSIWLLGCLLLAASVCKAQDQPALPSMYCDNPVLVAKAKEIILQKKSEGYILLEGGFYELTNKVIQPIMVHLDEKKAYYFIVVGQPDLDFLEVGLGHEAFGTDEIRDRIRKYRDHTYFTDFGYIPPFSGNFLLSVTENIKGRKKFCTAIYMMAIPKTLDIRSTYD